MERRGVQRQRTTPLGKALFKAGMIDWEERVRSETGQFYGWTTTGEYGLGVGVHSEAARRTNHIVSLFHIRTGEENRVKFSSLEHLESYPPSAVPRTALENWIAFIGSLSPTERGHYYVVPRLRVVENVEVLLERMRPLMGVLGRGHDYGHPRL